MIDGLQPVSGVQLTVIQGGAGSPAPATAPSPATAPAPAADPAGSDFPATPPPDVLAQLDHAAQVLKELARRNVNLHFEYDHVRKDVQVQVVDGTGRVVREIPPARLLDVLSGGTGQGLAVSATG